MHAITNDNIDLFVSDDVYAESKRHWEGTGRPIEEAVIENVLSSDVLEPVLGGAYRKYVELFGQLTGNPRLAILDAHGGSRNGDWTYWDGTAELDLQP